MKISFKKLKRALSSDAALKKLTGTEDIDELKVFFDMYPEQQENFIWMARDVMKMKNPKAHYIIAFMHNNNVMAKTMAGKLSGAARRKFDRTFKRSGKKIDKTVKKLSKGVKKDDRV